MQARIQSMKQQNWVDSDEFVKANITAISPELRDLLDKIFVADEFKRITMKVTKHDLISLNHSRKLSGAQVHDFIPAALR